MKKAQKGYMTVELAIIFPVIFFTILFILNMCMTHYQNIVTATAAMQGAARGAAYWNRLGNNSAWDFQTKGDDGAIGALAVTDFSDHDPYRYLFDGKVASRQKSVEAYTAWLLRGSDDIVPGKTGDMTVSKTGNIFQKYVEVTVTKQYINPFGHLAAAWGFTLPDQYKITAKAPLMTPTEFIRDVSFIYDEVKGKGVYGE